MTSTSFGFNVPASGDIQITDHDVLINGDSILNSSTPSSSWAINTTVTTNFEIDLDLPEVLRSCSLPDGAGGTSADLGAVINWKSTRTGLHGATEPQILVDGLNQISAEVDGSVLGGDLRLRISVILINNPSPDLTVLAPTRFGSRLWEQAVHVQLDGAGSQFPVSAFNFKEIGLRPYSALWHVEISGQLDSHVSSAVRLKLNSGHQRVEKYLQDPASEENAEFGTFMRADTISQLIIFALNSNAEQLRLEAEEKGTFAEALLEIHGMHFPTMSLESTRELFMSDPGFISSTIQGNVFSQKSRTK